MKIHLIDWNDLLQDLNKKNQTKQRKPIKLKESLVHDKTSNKVITFSHLSFISSFFYIFLFKFNL